MANWKEIEDYILHLRITFVSLIKWSSFSVKVRIKLWIFFFARLEWLYCEGGRITSMD